MKAMYIERVPNRNSPPAVLLRETYREDGKVKKRTLANLSKWPEAVVEGLRVLLKGGTAVAKLEDSFDVVRSQPHGHVAAVVGMLQQLNVGQLVGGRGSRNSALVLALIAARILDPRSKLATARSLDTQTLGNSLGEVLGVAGAREDELYAAMDWLLERQPRIEAQLAKRHLHDGALVLYDTSSTYFEGRHCPLAELGNNKDGKKGKLQIVFGLLCNEQGCPVAVEVFSGNTADPATLGCQIEKVRTRFGLERVIWVSDRGLITQARIREELSPCPGMDWITALRAPQIQQLVAGGSLQLSLFDETDLAEISDPAYPDERLIVCRNPLLAQERARKRTELLASTEQALDTIVQAARRSRRPLRGADRIGLRVGKVLHRFKMAKHFLLDIGEEHFTYARDEAAIAAEAALDGFYVIRTSVSSETLSTEKTVRAYKGLSVVERAFRSIKTVDLKIRPIHHRLASRVKAHVFLCMLAYYVEWHMRQALAPLLFDDHDPAAGQAERTSEVAPAQRSPAALRKTHRQQTDDGLPVHSFQSLLADLATISKDRIQPRLAGAAGFDKMTRPTPLQQRAFELLAVRLR